MIIFKQPFMPPVIPRRSTLFEVIADSVQGRWKRVELLGMTIGRTSTGGVSGYILTRRYEVTKEFKLLPS